MRTRDEQLKNLQILETRMKGKWNLVFNNTNENSKPAKKPAKKNTPK